VNKKAKFLFVGFLFVAGTTTIALFDGFADAIGVALMLMSHTLEEHY